MIVMQLEGLCIYRLVEGPGVRRMLLGKNLFKDNVTVFEMIVELAFLVALLLDILFFQIFFGRFDGSACTLSSGNDFTVFGLQHRSGRLTSAGSDHTGCGCGSVCFPLHPFLLRKIRSACVLEHKKKNR